MVQLLYRFYVGSENIAQTSRTEASCKINNYISDLIIKLQKLKNTEVNFILFADVSACKLNSSINRSLLQPGLGSITIWSVLVHFNELMNGQPSHIYDHIKYEN
jgi:hypothetical protein